MSRLSHTRGLERDSCCNLFGGEKQRSLEPLHRLPFSSRESKNACSDQRAGLDKLLMQQVVLLGETGVEGGGGAAGGGGGGVYI